MVNNTLGNSSIETTALLPRVLASNPKNYRKSNKFQSNEKSVFDRNIKELLVAFYGKNESGIIIISVASIQSAFP